MHGSNAKKGKEIELPNEISTEDAPFIEDNMKVHTFYTESLVFSIILSHSYVTRQEKVTL